MASGRLRLDYPKWVLHFRADMGFGGYDKIVQPAIRRIRQNSAIVWSHRHPEFFWIARYIRSLGDVLEAGIAVDDLLIAMQQLGCWGYVVNVGSRGDDSMDQAVVFVHTSVVLPLRGPAATSRSTTGCSSCSGASPDLPSSIYTSASSSLGLRPRKGGAGGDDQGGLDGRALPHRHAPCEELGYFGHKDLLHQLLLLHQLAESQDRRLIRDPVTDQLDAGKAAHGGYLNQGLPSPGC